MSEQPTDLTHELLRQIRAERSAFRGDVERRFDGLGSDMPDVKRTLRGLTCMMATFTSRLEDVETRVDRLTPQ